MPNEEEVEVEHLPAVQKCPPTIRDESRIVKHQLTPEELISAAQRMADAQGRLGGLEEQLKSYKAQNKAEVQEAEAEVAKFSQKVREGYEQREVDVCVYMDWTEEKVFVTRKDTDECIEERPMTKGELEQLPM